MKAKKQKGIFNTLENIPDKECVIKDDNVRSFMESMLDFSCKNVEDMNKIEYPSELENKYFVPSAVSRLSAIGNIETVCDLNRKLALKNNCPNLANYWRHQKDIYNETENICQSYAIRDLVSIAVYELVSTVYNKLQNEFETIGEDKKEYLKNRAQKYISDFVVFIMPDINPTCIYNSLSELYGINLREVMTFEDAMDKIEVFVKPNIQPVVMDATVRLASQIYDDLYHIFLFDLPVNEIEIVVSSISPILQEFEKELSDAIMSVYTSMILSSNGNTLKFSNACKKLEDIFGLSHSYDDDFDDYRF